MRQRKKKTSKTNNLGRKYLVENCQQIAVSTYLKKTKINLKKLILESLLNTEGIDIELTTSKTHFNGLRLWFKCPLCHRRIGIIYKHPISQILGCRVCLELEYRCRRYKGMVENSIT